jgi:hypothetical protein
MKTKIGKTGGVCRFCGKEKDLLEIVLFKPGDKKVEKSIWGDNQRNRRIIKTCKDCYGIPAFFDFVGGCFK